MKRLLSLLPILCLCAAAQATQITSGEYDVCASGCDYTSLQAAIDSCGTQDGDLTIVVKDALNPSGGIQINHDINGNKFHLTADIGHGGNPAAGRLISHSVNGHFLDVDITATGGGWVEIDSLNLKCTATLTAAYFTMRIDDPGAADSFVVHDILIDKNGQQGKGLEIENGAEPVRAYNIMIWDIGGGGTGNRGFKLSPVNDNFIGENIIVYNSDGEGFLFNAGAATGVLRNCAAYSCDVACFSSNGTIAGYHNICDDGTCEDSDFAIVVSTGNDTTGDATADFVSTTDTDGDDFLEPTDDGLLDGAGDTMAISGHSKYVNRFSQDLTNIYVGAKGLSAYTNSISQTFQDYAVLQRDSSDTFSTVSISGYYATGTSPDSVQVQVRDYDADSAIVDWYTIDNSLSGNTWSGSVAIPCGYWYRLRVRWFESGSPSDTVAEGSRFGVGLCYIWAGQSNVMSGTGDLDTSVSGISQYDTANIWLDKWRDPPMIGGNKSSITSAAESLYYDLDYPIGVTAVAQGGTNFISGQWGSGGVRYEQAIDQMQRMSPHTATKMEGLVWIQGEGDAANANAYYYDSLSSMISKMRDSIGSDLKFYITQIGRDTDTGDAVAESLIVVRKAQADLDTPSSLIWFAATNMINGTSSNHYHATAHDSLGARIANTILYSMGRRDYYRGHRILSAGHGSDDSLVNVQLYGPSSDFTPTAAIEGWECCTSGVWTGADSAYRVAANMVRLICPGDADSVRYQWGENPSIVNAIWSTGLVFDLPMEPSVVNTYADTLYPARVTWLGSVSTAYGTAGNWDLDFVPRAIDTVVFPTASTVATGGASVPYMEIEGTLTITDGCTIARMLCDPGAVITWEVGETFTLTTLSAGDWNGTAGNLVEFKSSSGGSPATLTLPNAYTASYMQPTDMIADGFAVDATDGTNVDGGGNTNWTFPSLSSTNWAKKQSLQWMNSWMQWSRRFRRHQ